MNWSGDPCWALAAAALSLKVDGNPLTGSSASPALAPANAHLPSRIAVHAGPDLDLDTIASDGAFQQTGLSDVALVILCFCLGPFIRPPLSASASFIRLS
jgi:hypothetical protein